VTLMPTVHCLVQLVEPPYTVVPLADVEIINLERVGFNGKTFDLVVIFKDFARDTLMVGSIQTQSLDDIKNWLTTQDIKFFESKLNLQWKQILKTIVADPEQFMETVRTLHRTPFLQRFEARS
jgi:nucleosome binding factor SPN SPT16 subunit